MNNEDHKINILNHPELLTMLMTVEAFLLIGILILHIKVKEKL